MGDLCSFIEDDSFTPALFGIGPDQDSLFIFLQSETDWENGDIHSVFDCILTWPLGLKSFVKGDECHRFVATRDLLSNYCE
jgi:hypothetical protein